MKSTGIVRKVDKLGRIVVPIELRKTLQIENDDPLEIFIDGETIVLKKYQPGCKFCPESRNLIDFKDVKICRECKEELVKLNRK